MPRYTFSKSKYLEVDIENIIFYFDNEDSIELKYGDYKLLDYEFIMYDKLIKTDRMIHPFLKAGYMNIDISESSNKNDIAFEILNKSIDKVKIIDADRFIRLFNGFFKVNIDNDIIHIEVVGKPLDEPSESDTLYFDSNELDKSNVQSINLDFMDCDSIKVFGTDIIDIDLVINEELELGFYSLERMVIGGSITLSLNPNYECRPGLLKNIERYDITNEEAINKIMSNELHCICNLYFVYNKPGYGDFFEEKIIVKDARFDTMVEFIDALELEPWFIGGKVKEVNDEIIIEFNKLEE